MSDYELLPGLYLAPTPAGAYFAVSSPADDVLRRLLLILMRGRRSPALTQESLVELTGLEIGLAMERLHHLQSLRLVQGLREPRQLPEGNLEQALPALLAELAGRGRALLADDHGFYLASHGFHHETAEELAGLSADLGLLHQRHQGLISNNLSLRSSAWALINAGGNSEIGFWPLYVGSQRFVLILTGLPNLNQVATLDLVWSLVRRYGS